MESCPGAFDNIASLYAAERFGCDLSKAGAESDINSYRADVLAVADGRVVKAVEGSLKTFVGAMGCTSSRRR